MFSGISITGILGTVCPEQHITCRAQSIRSFANNRVATRTVAVPQKNSEKYRMGTSNPSFLSSIAKAQGLMDDRGDKRKPRYRHDRIDKYTTLRPRAVANQIAASHGSTEGYALRSLRLVFCPGRVEVKNRQHGRFRENCSPISVESNHSISSASMATR